MLLSYQKHIRSGTVNLNRWFLDRPFSLSLHFVSPSPVFISGLDCCSMSCWCTTLNFSLSLLIWEKLQFCQITDLILVVRRKERRGEHTLLSSTSASRFRWLKECTKFVISKTLSSSFSKAESKSSRRSAGNLSTTGIRRKQLNCKQKGELSEELGSGFEPWIGKNRQQ